MRAKRGEMKDATRKVDTNETEAVSMTQSAFTPELKAQAVSALSPFSSAKTCYVDPAALLRMYAAHEEQAKALEEARGSERSLSSAYVRLRHIIPGALDTSYGPTPQEVWDHTEDCARTLVDRYLGAEQSADALRRRVEKLEAALRDIENECDPNDPPWRDPEDGRLHLWQTCRAALAEDAAEKLIPTGKPTP